MRTEGEILSLIDAFARERDEIRVVLLNGSRANTGTEKDQFQDFDIACFVEDLSKFSEDRTFLDRFGERLIMQIPQLMGPEPDISRGITFLMRFTDGNRIDLNILPLNRLKEELADSQTTLLLDKDNRVGKLPAASDQSYLPSPPTQAHFNDCCNEFWWVSTYVAKGLWRQQLTYAKGMFDGPVRAQLMIMLDWYVGFQTKFSKSTGMAGKNLERLLDKETWERLCSTYADGDYGNSWKALFAMTGLFDDIAKSVARHAELEYNEREANNVKEYLAHQTQST